MIKIYIYIIISKFFLSLSKFFGLKILRKNAYFLFANYTLIFYQQKQFLKNISLCFSIIQNMNFICFPFFLIGFCILNIISYFGWF